MVDFAVEAAGSNHAPERNSSRAIKKTSLSKPLFFEETSAAMQLFSFSTASS